MRAVMTMMVMRAGGRCFIDESSVDSVGNDSSDDCVGNYSSVDCVGHDGDDSRDDSVGDDGDDGSHCCGALGQCLDR